MKAQLIQSVLLLAAGSAIADERAVEAIHYEADLDIHYYDSAVGVGSGSANTRTLQSGLSGALTVPLGQSFGASLAGSYSIGSSEADAALGSLEGDNKQLYGEANVFYRNPKYGRISIGYEAQRADFSYTFNANGVPATYDETTETHGYLGLVEAYVGPVTLGINDRQTYADYRPFSNDKEDLIFATARWYATPNVRVGVQMGFEDADDTYVADIEFQPAFVRNMAGFRLSYLRRDDGAVSTDYVSLGFNFYFDKRFDLVTRDRHYR